MTIVNALRFDTRSGAMVTDEESWHLRRRKTRFNVNLFSLTSGAQVEIAYGGAGDPRYHREVVTLAMERLAQSPPATVEEAGKVVLSAMHSSTRRLVDDRLRFLFGFDADDLNRGSFALEDETYEIKNPSILKRARAIVEGKEQQAGRDLAPPNQVALLGWDPDGGLQMFCLKESDGVLSFNAGGFESLGPGRYAGGMRLGSVLGERTLRERRSGFPRADGMVALLDSILDAADHFGMVGGKIHILTLDGARTRGSRISLLEADRSWLATEVVKGRRGGFIPSNKAAEIVDDLVFEGLTLRKGEDRLFETASDPEGLELYLRGYKTSAVKGFEARGKNRRIRGGKK